MSEQEVREDVPPEDVDEPSDLEWDENEPSPHQGEEGQQESE
jgi:hypothetical protein